MPFLCLMHRHKNSIINGTPQLHVTYSIRYFVPIIAATIMQLQSGIVVMTW